MLPGGTVWITTPSAELVTIGGGADAAPGAGATDNGGGASGGGAGAGTPVATSLTGAYGSGRWNPAPGLRGGGAPGVTLGVAPSVAPGELGDGATTAV